MKKQKYAVVGYPLSHTMSPFIHSKLFELSGISADYNILEISPQELSHRFTEIEQLNGANITIPHKSAVIPFLTKLDERAALYGAVNTIAKQDGDLVGYNTDCHGFLRALNGAGIPLQGHAVVCGCGGVARMIAFECIMAGCSLTLAVRETDLSTAQAVQKEIADKFPQAEIKTTLLSDICGDIDLLINGTPVGMYPYSNAMPVSENILHRTKAVFDVIYNPAETLLLKTARSCGAKTAGGMPMLVWQAAVAQEIWNNVSFTGEDIDKIIRMTYEKMAEQFERQE